MKIRLVWPGSAAAQAKPALQPGDKIVMVDGQTVKDYQQLSAYLAEHPDKTLQLTVECTVPRSRREIAMQWKPPKLVDVTVPPQPMRTLGLVMTMGEIDGGPRRFSGGSCRNQSARSHRQRSTASRWTIRCDCPINCAAAPVRLSP